MTAAADEWILEVGVFHLVVGPLPDVVSLAFAESEHLLGLNFCSTSVHY